VGCTKNPRRAFETGPDGLGGDGVEIHGPASAAAVAAVARVSEEPRSRSDRDGLLHGADGDLSSPVRARDADPQPAAADAFECDGASDGGMEGAATARGMRAGGGVAVSDSGPRPNLWRAIFASGPDIGHPGSGDCTSLAVANRVCRASGWFDSPGMPRPRCRDRRTASSRDPGEVR